MKKFRERENAETEKLVANTTPEAPKNHSNSSLLDVAESAQELAQHELEKLPTEIIRQVRAFHDHMRFFANSGGTVAEEAVNGEAQKRSGIPKQLRQLLDEISELEDIGERAKREILEDDDSRNVRNLCISSIGMEAHYRNSLNRSSLCSVLNVSRDGILDLLCYTHRFQQVLCGSSQIPLSDLWRL